MPSRLTHFQSKSHVSKSIFHKGIERRQAWIDGVANMWRKHNVIFYRWFSYPELAFDMIYLRVRCTIAVFTSHWFSRIMVKWFRNVSKLYYQAFLTGCLRPNQSIRITSHRAPLNLFFSFRLHPVSLHHITTSCQTNHNDVAVIWVKSALYEQFQSEWIRIIWQMNSTLRTEQSMDATKQFCLTSIGVFPFSIGRNCDSRRHNASLGVILLGLSVQFWMTYCPVFQSLHSSASDGDRWSDKACLMHDWLNGFVFCIGRASEPHS